MKLDARPPATVLLALHLASAFHPRICVTILLIARTMKMKQNATALAARDSTAQSPTRAYLRKKDVTGKRTVRTVKTSRAVLELSPVMDFTAAYPNNAFRRRTGATGQTIVNLGKTN